jgi:hypothetical protein
MLICFELYWAYHRKKRKGRWSFFFVGLILMSLSLAWFVKRGDLNSDRWVREFLNES